MTAWFEERHSPPFPPKVEYELTPLGISLIEPLKTLLSWSERNSQNIEAARQAFDLKNSQ